MGPCVCAFYKLCIWISFNECVSLTLTLLLQDPEPMYMLISTVKNMSFILPLFHCLTFPVSRPRYLCQDSSTCICWAIGHHPAARPGRRVNYSFGPCRKLARNTVKMMKVGWSAASTAKHIIYNKTLYKGAYGEQLSIACFETKRKNSKF